MILTRLCALLLISVALWSHPMGNYSVSHYTRFEPRQDGVAMVYTLDLAEIPTVELLSGWSLDRNSPRGQLEARAQQQAREWVSRLKISTEGRTVRPRFDGARLTVEDGAGGVPVIRIASNLWLPVTPGRISFEDPNYAERAGWKEIVVRAGKGASVIRSSSGADEKSQGLTAYPQDPTVAPPQDVKTEFEWTSGAPPVSPVTPPAVSAATPAAVPAGNTGPTPPQPAPPGTVVRGDYLSQLLKNRDLTFGMILAGLGAAFAFGAMHALSPGHGKTLVAAYLVGARGTWKHAVFLGAMTTFTHTVSVFLLGFVTLFLADYVAPETLSPILGAISGFTIVWIGGSLFYRRLRKYLDWRAHERAHALGLDHGHVHQREQVHTHALTAAGHHHGHSHSDPEHHHHHHHDHDHEHHHGPGGHTHVPEGEVTISSLIALGASGGLVPCPSALVLLLSSVYFQRVGLGLLLLVSFSAGLAAVLTGIGLMILYAKQLLPNRESTVSHPLFRLVPVASAAVIFGIGVVMTAVSLGIVKPERLLG